MKKFSLGFTQHHFGDSQKLNKLIKFIKSGAGFTLVELLIVIAIIGILAAAAVSIINPVAQFQKANDARRKSDLVQIQKVLELYYQDQGRYPASSNNLKITDQNGATINWGDPWPPYMGTLPKDPSSSKNYAYNSDGQTYYLYASLERGGSDSQACNSDGSSCSSISANQTACGSACSYGVSSPNVSVSNVASINVPTGVPTPTPPPGPRPPCGIYGDVDGNEYITNNDSTLISEYLTGSLLTDDQKIRADVDLNTGISVGDGGVIQGYTSGFRSTFAICQKKPPCASYGNVDLDSWVSRNDYQILGTYIGTGMPDLNQQQKNNADVTTEYGAINNLDKISIGRYLSGFDNTFSVCTITPTP